jgi:hypothetical protein
MALRNEPLEMAAKRISKTSKPTRVFGQRQEPAKMFRVGLYARVSTHDQQTLPLQMRAMRDATSPCIAGLRYFVIHTKCKWISNTVCAPAGIPFPKFTQRARAESRRLKATVLRRSQRVPQPQSIFAITGTQQAVLPNALLVH